ncbi:MULTISPECIES: DISARM system phospholipase D-like protein DrmC [Rhodococcus]|uniref:DISARM system phospholipase D-like protein DrmC n=1 Tax=Rhodococcus TaxID=1827 RepID=UPI0029549620|nr:MULTISPECIES: DISARM system phospholipase D-like protein DrmC [Rhodococcus]MDV7246233.1 DISARM system phospholipase D-like protein DrmC [Rhodococcus oxybenzonivorans]MDV7337295.1 DISARM system phospholipase D-like protein DrmC [Rhodococcus oxybenzonivorans]MDV8030717.1 DISARM system phospholipase D-like protein DrmC [Rhodococcus sp. IEGM 27]
MDGELASRQLLETAASVGRGLRPAHAERLAAALAPLEHADEAQHLVGLIPTPAFGQSVQLLLAAWSEHPGPRGLTVGTAIAAAAHAHQDARRNPHLELVVSGPTSKVIHARRTEQVLLQLIDQATQSILLITYALHMHEHLRDALTAATARGVTVTVLAEDPDDNPKFSGTPTKALSGLVVNRLRWHTDQRPPTGAALHAKVVVIDEDTALITSANITKRAAGDNIEAGLLVRGGDIPQRLVGHVNQLLQQQVLRWA